MRGTPCCGAESFQKENREGYKIKCPTLGDDNPYKDAKIGPNKYLIWKKAFWIWEVMTRISTRRIGVI